MVNESDKIPGWKKLNAKVYLHSMNTISSGISWQQLSVKTIIGYYIHFPDNWVFEGSSIFYNKEKKKVAELFPVGVGNIDELYKNSKSNMLYGVELINKELVTINGYKGLKIINKTDIDGGTIPFWYPHTYLISKGDYVFCIVFYSYEINQSDQELFEKLLAHLILNNRLYNLHEIICRTTYNSVFPKSERI